MSKKINNSGRFESSSNAKSTGSNETQNEYARKYLYFSKSDPVQEEAYEFIEKIGRYRFMSSFICTLIIDFMRTNNIDLEEVENSTLKKMVELYMDSKGKPLKSAVQTTRKEKITSSEKRKPHNRVAKNEQLSNNVSEIEVAKNEQPEKYVKEIEVAKNEQPDNQIIEIANLLDDDDDDILTGIINPQFLLNGLAKFSTES